VIHTGNNSEGALAWWEHIQPRHEWAFSVESRRYAGAFAPGWVAGDIAYAITGFRPGEFRNLHGENPLACAHTNPSPNTLSGVDIVLSSSRRITIGSTLLDPAISPVPQPGAPARPSHCNQYYSPRALHPSEPKLPLARHRHQLRHPQRTTRPPTTIKAQPIRFFSSWDGVDLLATYQEAISGLNLPDRIAAIRVRHDPFVFFDSSNPTSPTAPSYSTFRNWAAISPPTPPHGSSF